MSTEIFKRKEGKRAAILVEWGWRALATGLLIGNMYLKGNFVTLEQYQKDLQRDAEFRDRIQNEQENILQMQKVQEERDKVNERQDEQLKDHEQRIRALERGK